MKRILFPVLIGALTVSGCARLADSRANPLNWFGGSREGKVVSTERQGPLVDPSRLTQVIDNRSLINSVTAMSVDRTPGGALVRATGIAQTQGFYNAQLTIAGVEADVLTLEFRAQRPNDIQIAGSNSSREITVARALTDAELVGIRTIRVIAAQNSRSSRR